MTDLGRKIINAAFGLVMGTAILTWGLSSFKEEIIKTYKGYEAALKYPEKIKDLNGNDIPEKYIELNDKKYFLEVDGKSIESSLK
jgi:hypothetical protein